MSLTLQTDQATQALALLLTQFKGKPGIEALLTALIKQVQELEIAAFDVLNLRSLADATGAQLDGIGRIIDLVRDGRDDDTYRAALTTKVLINNTSCTNAELIRIIPGLIADTYTFVQTEGPTSIDVDFTRDLGDTPTPLAVARLLRRIVAAGVRCVIAWDDSTEDAAGEAFSLGPDPDIDGHSTGLGDATGATGGMFIRASDGEITETLS